jgi:hypothetical protein
MYRCRYILDRASSQHPDSFNCSPKLKLHFYQKLISFLNLTILRKNHWPFIFTSGFMTSNNYRSRYAWEKQTFPSSDYKSSSVKKVEVPMPYCQEKFFSSRIYARKKTQYLYCLYSRLYIVLVLLH